MDTAEYANLAELMALLAEPLSLNLSGSFFIATDDNTSCRFGIEQGQITHCSYRRERGLAALKALQAGIRGRGVFSENRSTFFTARDEVQHKDAVWLLDIRTPEIPEPEPEANEAEHGAEDASASTRIYRGQVITDAREEPANADEPATKKPPRMYRGQRLDD